MSQLISVITPSRRVERLERYFWSLYETTPRGALETITIVDGAGLDSVAVALEYSDKVIVRSERGGAPSAWNEGAAIARGDFFLLGADDIRFKPGWFEAAMAEMRALDCFGMVGFNDESPNARGRGTHYLVSRRYAVERWGGVMVCPHYDHNYTDWEAEQRARLDGAYRWAEQARVEHEHYDWNKNLWDETYARTKATMNEDQALYSRREKAGFPNDYPAAFGLR